MAARSAREDEPERTSYQLLRAGRNARHGRVCLLEVPARLAGVAGARSFIDSLDLGGRFPPERIFDMKVTMSEAVANAIEHAKAEVKVWVWLMPDRLVIEVLNEGEFGPQSTERPREPGRGYGLKLMVALADEVTFVRARRGSTKVLLTFRYPRDDG